MITRMLGAAALTLLVVAASALAQDTTSTEKKIKAAVDAIKEIQATPGTDRFEPNVRELMFRLAIGNLTGDPKLKLSSETRAYLDDNVEQLNKLLTDNEMQAKLAANPKLVTLLDRIVRLRPQLVKKKDLAHKEERDRLNQLRDLSTSYRDLTASLAAMNTYYLLGDFATVRKLHDDVATRLKAIEEVAGRRVDYYLFKDEPKLDAAEVKLLTTVAEPLAHDMLTHFKSLQGLMAYRLASDPRIAMSKDDRKKGLEGALSQVKDLVADPKKASLLAHYVDGISREELGLLETAEQPLDEKAHIAAQTHFKEARASFDKANTRLLTEVKTADRIGGDLKRRQAELASSKVFLDEAAKRLAEGRPDEAATILSRGLRLHRDSKLVVALAQAGLRAGRNAPTRELLTTAVKGGALTDADREGLIVRGRAELARAWDRLAVGPSKVPPGERKLLLADLREARTLLTLAAGDARLSQPAAAYSALSRAYATYLDADSDAAVAKEAFGKLRDVVNALKEQLDKAGSDAEKASLREALVAARLAQGFLAIRFQPVYQDDALLAFAAAADEQARIPGGQMGSKLFGSPVLSAMLSRPDMKGLKIAAEERQLRELVGRVAEGLAAMKLGAADAAAKQMKASLTQIEALAGEPPLDAGKILDQKEADARAALRLRARSLAVLTLVAGNQPDVALVEALKLSSVKSAARNAENVSEVDVKLAAGGVSDPLANYALGLAVEEYAATKLKPGSAPARALLAEAAKVQSRTRELLAKSPTLLDRYPQIAILTDQAIERLTRPETYVARARKLRRDAQVTDAVRLIEEGLRRHPEEQDLQQERILAKLDEADLTPGRASDVIKQAVAEAEQASKDGVLREARGLIALGEAHERLGQLDDAIAAYRKALKARPAVEVAIKARVRVSVLTARLDRRRAPTK